MSTFGSNTRFRGETTCWPAREQQQVVRQCIEAPCFGGRDSIGGALVCSASSSGFLAAIAEGSHPIPSRTRKLSPPAPMVLQGRPCGRVGRCQIYGSEVLCGTSGPFFIGCAVLAPVEGNVTSPLGARSRDALQGTFGILCANEDLTMAIAL